MFFKTFRWSFGITILAMIVAYIYGGWTALFLTAILGVLETSLSFDNAVVNARVLERMTAFWQKMFLTVGIVIAVFGMRIIFPLLIVGVTAHLNPVEAVQLALEKGDPHEPGTYGYLLNEAHPQIAAFGGMFLFMLFLDFIFEERDIKWLTWLEKPLAKVGRIDAAPLIVALVSLVLTAQFLAAPEEASVVLLSGVLGMVTYLVVNSLGSLFESAGEKAEEAHAPGIAGDAESIDEALERSGGPSGMATAVAKGGFFSFLYLEVLDASFSFDGVIGAFAITADPIIIALGLGLIGAMFVRSMTIYLVRKGTLNEYVYLDHGAHWAIGALATILLVSIGIHINEVLTGLIGAVFIIAAFLSSLRYNKKHRTSVSNTTQDTSEIGA